MIFIFFFILLRVSLRLATPPAGLERVQVCAAPRSQWAQPRHGDQNARAHEPPALLAHRSRRAHAADRGELEECGRG
jgi:hypothetical protein